MLAIPHHSWCHSSPLLPLHHPGHHAHVVEPSWQDVRDVHLCIQFKDLIYNLSYVQCRWVAHGTSVDSLAGPISERVVNPVALQPSTSAYELPSQIVHSYPLPSPGT